MLRGLRRTAQAAALLAGVYLAIVLVGLIPVNNGFQPAADGVTIFVVSTALHADIVVPITTEAVDWREHFAAGRFAGDTSKATHVAFGWGDRNFYLQTPTWADLKPSTAAKALFWPSDACMHVSLLDAASASEDARAVTISQQQYAQLARHILGSFMLDEHDRKVEIAGAAYALDDAFFEARGSFHCVNTCNAWAGRAMQAAGIRTPWLSPLPRTVWLYLPD